MHWPLDWPERGHTENPRMRKKGRQNYGSENQGQSKGRQKYGSDTTGKSQKGRQNYGSKVATENPRRQESLAPNNTPQGWAQSRIQGGKKVLLLTTLSEARNTRCK
jgi:hypothetical protein